MTARTHPLDALTAQERVVAGLVADGLSNRDIAQRLEITESTVKKHVGSAMHKTGTHRRGQLALVALVDRCPHCGRRLRSRSA